MRIKSVFRLLHLWLGLSSGLVVFIVATTGCIYAFEEEIRSVIHRDVLEVQPGSNRQSLEQMMHSVKESNPRQKIKNIRVYSDPARSVEINLKNNTGVYVDPYTGKVLGSIDRESEFLAVVLKIHRSLYLGDVGKLITGVSAFIFLFMLISGIILWWPGRRQKLKQKFSLARNAGWRRLNYDLHSVLGFYASWIIIFTVLTGLVWSFKWMESGMYSITGSVKENPVKIKSALPVNGKTASMDDLLQAGLAEATEISKEQVIFLPEDSTGAVRMNIRYVKEGFFTRQDQLFFDQYSGKLLKDQLFKNSSAGDKLKATNYNIHTGKVLGLPGQFLVFFAALISASLPITGLLFWLGKRRDKINFRRRGNGSAR
jgi:uncharacterized iron-regulated membrane protein